MVGWKRVVGLLCSAVLAACAPTATAVPEPAGTSRQRPDGAAAGNAGLQRAPLPRPRTFEFSTSPWAPTIPDAPVAGEANGQPFKVAFIAFQQQRETWQMLLSEDAPEAPADALQSGQFVVVDLPEEPHTGWLNERSAAYGGGFWQLDDPAQPGRTMGWNATNGWALQIDRWELASTSSDQPGVLGQADGWVAVAYQGTEQLLSSWVAGRFQKAVIRGPAPPADDPR